MVPRTAIVALDADTPMPEVVRVATESPYTRFPVYEGDIDQIIGIAHVRDVATATTQADGGAHLRQLLRPVLLAPATMSADRLLVRLKEERRTMAVLVDEFGGTAGLITIDNILDDLIGDIADEFRPSAPGPERLPDGRVRMPGGLPVGDAAAWTRVRWEPRAVTVGGLVTTWLGRVPRPGDRLRIEGVEVEVERVEHRSALSVLVTPARTSSRDDGPSAGERSDA
jgi:CBS domain containing-hemolysin-like protein